MNRNVLVVGYYNRKNLGDDVFEYVLSKYFQHSQNNISYKLITADDLKEIPDNTSAVIFGGGDLVNDYFYRKIEPFILNKTCPWYAVSIGIPYPKLIDQGYLDRFDYIIHRNQHDIDILRDRYDIRQTLVNNNIMEGTRQNNRSKWFPDISFMMPRSNNIEYETNKYRSKKIGVFLSRNIYYKDDTESYDRIVDNISKFIYNVAKTYRNVWTGCCFEKVPLYEFYFLPFCTDGKDNHDDRLINSDIYRKLLSYGELDNIYLFNDEIEMDKIIPIFNSFHATICTRFHAHMFSLMCKKPILSIYSTRKVENLIEEIGAEEYSCKFDTHSTSYYPTNIDTDKLINTFLHLEHNYNSYLSKLNNTHNLYIRETANLIEYMDNLLFYLPRYMMVDEINKKGIEIAYDITKNITNIAEINDIDKIVNVDGAIKWYFSESMKDIIVETISYFLTGNRFSEYHYGLNQQVFTDGYNLRESCKWILNHYIKNNPTNYNILKNNTNLDDRKLNMSYINNNLFKGYHRSGWNYVLDEMNKLHNPEGIIFDSYLDKTFGWEYDFLTQAQVLPYTQPWIGVFHHTADEDYTNNNLVTSFNKYNFINSLKFCKGIITLSRSNAEWINNKLIEILGHDKIIVLSLSHPTEFVNNKLMFEMDNFIMNPCKKVVQVGAWLRDTYAIYDLNVPTGYHKFALKGKEMNNYFISENDIEKLERAIKNIACGRKIRTSGCMVENKDANKYIVGLLDSIKTEYNSVTILDNISNGQYDELLKSSIVFIKLVDAAAVNTILECIVRNTPILLNRLPATEEYLGSDYPLFYDNLNHASELLSNINNIKKAHKYLSKMNKNKYKVEYFLHSLINSRMYSNI